MDDVPVTRTELARRHGVSASAITRALHRADERARTDPNAGLPPQPINPGGSPLLYLPEPFAAWWPTRPGRGRPARTSTTRNTARKEL